MSNTIFYKDVKERFDVILFIVRGQPFHKAHKRNIEIAETLADKVAVGLGSANAAPSPKNPLYYAQRAAMVRAEFPEKNVCIFGVDDYTYNDDRWITAVRQQIAALTFGIENPKIALIGHSKDESSYYLKIFPTWTAIEVPNIDNINATEIREGLFEGTEDLSLIPEKAREKLQYCLLSSNWKFARDEYNFYKNYKRPYKQLSEEEIAVWADNWMQEHEETDPTELVLAFAKLYKPKYPPKHLTVDAIVTCSGHVLLIKRIASPGKGLWALPGGHVEEDEKLLPAMIRELKEETKLDIPERTLTRCIVNDHLFDDPNRSLRGRSLTQAYHIDLGQDTKLPKIKASSDAKEVKWCPIAAVPTSQMFEDHAHIIDFFTNAR